TVHDWLRLSKFDVFGCGAQIDRRDLQLHRSAKLIACVFRILQFLIELAYFLGFSQKGGVSYES
ncbi:MAG: hypothetical protein WCF79_04615, partial [Rhodomicrobium sp.]